MGLARLTHTYLYAFYLLGYSSFNPRVHTDSGTTKKYFPAVVHQVIALSNSIACIFCQHFYVDFNEATNSFGIYILTLSFCSVRIAVSYQALHYADDFRELMYKFEFIAMYFKSNSTYEEQMERLRKSYRKRVYIVLIDFTITFIVTYWLMSPRTHVVVQTCLMVCILLSNLANLHAYFYVNLLQYFIQLIPARAPKGGGQHMTIDAVAVVLDNFKYYKCAYTKLWETSLHINDIFGWSFLALCLQNYIEFTYALYWVFLHFYVYNTILFLSNYIQIIMF